MSDQTLLVFGGAVSFIAVAGVYAYLRGSFERGTRETVHADLHARESRREIARPT